MTRRPADVQLHTFRTLDEQPALVSACTERWGGVSDPPYNTLNLALHVGDDPEAVMENRRRAAAALGLELDAFVVPEQVHRGAVAVVTVADRGRGAFSTREAVSAADALITRSRGVALAVMLADCVPILLYDPQRAAVGVAHAGWGGTVHHITRNTVAAMKEEFGTDATDVIAAVGPSIGPVSYEVGDEVAEKARAEFPEADIVRPRENGKWLFDLWRSNVIDLTSAGLLETNVYVTGIDTFVSTDRFFSDRRQRPTGRLMTIAALR